MDRKQGKCVVSDEQPNVDGALSPGLALRLEASLNTVVAFSSIGVVLAWVSNTVVPLDAYLMRSGIDAHTADVLTGIGPWIAALGVYVCDAATHRATYGMRRRGLRFSSSHGGLPPRIRVVLRCVVGFVMLPLIPVSVWMLARDPNRESIADSLCGMRIHRRV